MAETTQDTSMTISQMRDFIVDYAGVGPNTVAELTDEQVRVAYERALKAAETKTRKHKGGPVHKRPQMMGGGMYKGRKHAYAAGGTVKNLNIVKSK